MSKAKTLATTVSTGGALENPANVLLDSDIGVSVQAYDADLTSWAAIAPSAKQDTLVSGTSLKSINGTSLLGSGDLSVVTSPAGSTGQVQYNNAGTFGAVASGTSGQVLTSAGTGAAPTWSAPAAGGFSNMAVFTTSGTWTVPTGITKCKVYVTGGGGGGRSDGSGGGAGGTAIKVISGLTPGGSVTVTVGAAGADATAGGNSTFGAYCTGGGGQAGSTSVSSTTARGGVATDGDLNIAGGDGSFQAYATTSPGGLGGGSYWGGGAFVGRSATTNYGGGGGGGYNAGKYGAPGVVVIEY